MPGRSRLSVKRVSLATIGAWTTGDHAICHDEERYFSVVGVHVQATNREVASWDQPLVQSTEQGLIGFLAKRIGDVPHFLVQAKVEPGNPEVVAVGPRSSARSEASVYRLRLLAALPRCPA